MQFPVYFHLFGTTLPSPHMVMEATAYAAGLSLHLGIKAKLKSLGTVSNKSNGPLWLIAGAMCLPPHLLGAKLLALDRELAFSSPRRIPPARLSSFERLFGGKTIVGGLVGGWIGIELVKKLLSISPPAPATPGSIPSASPWPSAASAASSPAWPIKPMAIRHPSRGPWTSATESRGTPRNCTKSSSSSPWASLAASTNAPPTSISPPANSSASSCSLLLLLALPH